MGINRQHFNQIILGNKIPGIKFVGKIEEITQDKATKEELLFPEDFLDEEI